MAKSRCDCPSCRPSRPPANAPCPPPFHHGNACESAFPCPPRDHGDCPPPCPPPCPPRDHCDCPPPCPPPCPPKDRHNCPPRDRCRPEPSFQVLLPRIICSGREWQRRLHTELVVNGIPECAEPPFQLLWVQQSSASPWWEPAHDGMGRNQMMYHVFIPVCCCVRDACGIEYNCPAVVEMDACLHLNCPSSECWRHTLIIIPCVRLACGPVCSHNHCFDVELEVILELYMTRWEPCGNKPKRPVCPDLPLYPQPCR